MIYQSRAPQNVASIFPTWRNNVRFVLAQGPLAIQGALQKIRAKITKLSTNQDDNNKTGADFPERDPMGQSGGSRL